MDPNLKACIIEDVLTKVADKAHVVSSDCAREAEKIRKRYSVLKRNLHFSLAARQARVEWLAEFLAR